MIGVGTLDERLTVCTVPRDELRPDRARRKAGDDSWPSPSGERAALDPFERHTPDASDHRLPDLRRVRRQMDRQDITALLVFFNAHTTNPRGLQQIAE